MNKILSRREMIRLLALAAAGSLVACNTPDPTSGPVHGSPTRASGQADSPLPTSTQAPDPTSIQTQAGEPGQAQPAAPTPEQAYLAVARGEDPAAITEAALKALGGIERFVKSGYDVIVKPNICVEPRSFEYGATTNPVVVATLVRLALGAGARRVRVMDYPFGGTAENAYEKSGISAAVIAAGGEMEVMNSNKYRQTSIPDGKSLTETMAYQDALDCDLLINVPTAKHHSLARITAGCKNMMGLIQDRGAIHSDLAQRIPDLVSLFRPELTVVDAVRTLIAHGPSGGSLDDVRINNTVIASHDIVAADTYATGLFDLTGADIPYLVAAAERGLGLMDLGGLKIEEITV